jgi:hypothetical protein
VIAALCAAPPPWVIPDWRRLQRVHPKVIPDWRGFQRSHVNWRMVCGLVWPKAKSQWLTANCSQLLVANCQLLVFQRAFSRHHTLRRCWSIVILFARINCESVHRSFICECRNLASSANFLQTPARTPSFKRLFPLARNQYIRQNTFELELLLWYRITNSEQGGGRLPHSTHL